MVPDAEAEIPSDSNEPERFDEFPGYSRRRREDDRRRHEEELREDFDDRRRAPGFDPQARADAWERVYKGLGYIQIAVILYFVSQIMQTAFFLIRGVEEQNPNALPDSGEIAIAIFGLVIMVVAGGFWMLGRFAGVKVPYVPARGWARASFFMVLTGIGSLMGFCCLFIAALGALGAGPNGGALALLMLAVMVMLLGLVLVAGAEMCGLVSLAKIGTGLHNSSLANWARMSLVLMFVLIGGLTMGACGLSIYASQQKQQGQQPGNGPFAKAAKGKGQKNAAPKDKDKEIAKEKDKDKDKDNQQANANAQQQQPNPFEDDGLDEKTRFISQMVMIAFILLYLTHYSISLQKGRRAIRSEIEVLTGRGRDRHDHDYRDRY
jgi:hypothetical protein